YLSALVRPSFLCSFPGTVRALFCCHPFRRCLSTGLTSTGRTIREGDSHHFHVVNSASLRHRRPSSVSASQTDTVGISCFGLCCTELWLVVRDFGLLNRLLEGADW